MKPLLARLLTVVLDGLWRLHRRLDPAPRRSPYDDRWTP